MLRRYYAQKRDDRRRARFSSAGRLALQDAAIPCHQGGVTRRAILPILAVVSFVAGGSLASPSAARADNARVRVALSYDVMAGCPDEKSFREQIRARTERLEWVMNGADRHFAARVSVQDEQLVGRLDIQ